MVDTTLPPFFSIITPAALEVAIFSIISFLSNSPFAQILTVNFLADGLIIPASTNAWISTLVPLSNLFKSLKLIVNLLIKKESSNNELFHLVVPEEFILKIKLKQLTKIFLQ